MVITPIIDIADRAGVMTAPAQIGPIAWAWVGAKAAGFGVVGFAAAWLLRHHQPRDRTWFLSSCTVVLATYVVLANPTVSALASVGALAVAHVHLRAAHRAQALKWE